MKLSTITLIKTVVLITSIIFVGCSDNSETSLATDYEYIDEGENLNDQAMINRLTISAQNFIDQGDLDNAVEVLTRLILISPDNIDAYYKREYLLIHKCPVIQNGSCVLQTRITGSTSIPGNTCFSFVTHTKITGSA